MAYGGGTWLTQNKILPGTYVNFSSVAKASATLSDRGIAAVPLVLGWGEIGKPIILEANEFFTKSMEKLGYEYSADEMFPLREIFQNATKCVVYRLDATGEGDGITAKAKAAGTYATAKYYGIRGNDIKIKVAANIEDSNKFDVVTYVGSKQADIQTVSAYSDLISNEWVDFNISPAPTLTATAATALTGGDNGSQTVADYQQFLNDLESYSFNTLCCPVSDSTTVDLFCNYTKTMRDDYGKKFQCVAWQADEDYEGVIGVWNEATHPNIASVPINASVYWVTGAEAGCAINKSLTAKVYNGELDITVNETQSELQACITDGKLMFHRVDGDIAILEDINSFVSFEENKGDIFSMNQTIRVCDQIANDIAVLFNKRYLGKVQNDATGRTSLWGDIVYYIRELERLRAVENFDPDSVICEIGSTKKAVLLTIKNLSIINAMSQLYMSVIIE